MSSEPPPAERTPIAVSDHDIDDAIEACGGDVREAIRALLVGQQLLEELLEAAHQELSWGYVRGVRLGASEMRRKGEVGPGAIRRGFPFQVWFPEEEADDLLRGAGFYRSAAPRSLRMVRDGCTFLAICFADESDARAFMRHAGGELVGGS